MIGQNPFSPNGSRSGEAVPDTGTLQRLELVKDPAEKTMSRPSEVNCPPIICSHYCPVNDSRTGGN